MLISQQCTDTLMFVSLKEFGRGVAKCMYVCQSD